jgi:hypothetical protein
LKKKEMNQDDLNLTPSDVGRTTPRRWWQVSLRMVIAGFVLSSALIGFTATTWHRYKTEAAVVTRLINLGADVHYDYEYVNDEFTENSMPPGPAWLRRRLGQNFFARATLVCITGNQELTDVEFILPLRKLESVTLYNCDSIKNVDCLGKLYQLRHLDLNSCDGIVSLDALKESKTLQQISLHHCRSLESIDFLGDLPKLNDLNISRCDAIQDYQVLTRLDLQKLELMNSPLTNAEKLAMLDELEELYLDGSKSLVCLDGLKGLKALQKLDLRNCDQLTKLQIDTLKDQLPYTNIVSKY